MSGPAGSRPGAARSTPRRLAWALSCGHVVLWSQHPERGDVVWCRKCDAESVVEGKAGK